MLDKKLTDAEIIKALECCIKVRTLDDCKKSACPALTQQGCFYYLRTDEYYEGVIFVEVIKDALDLINRLQARLEKCEKVEHFADKTIEKLQAEKEALIAGQETLQKYIAEQKAENERLTKSVTTLTKSISELTNEVERQKKAKDESFLFAANILESEKIVIAETKAEAYKEFAERLKEQKYQSSDWSHGEHPFVVEESDIDNTLYDLVGE